MTARKAPYVHAGDGSPCWTKNCSLPNNAPQESFDDLPRVSAPPTQQELATFAAWLADPNSGTTQAALKDAMLTRWDHVEPALPGQSMADVDTEKLHAFFEDAYQERLHVLAAEADVEACLYHAMDVHGLMVEALSRYDEAADNGDVDAMRDVLFLNQMDTSFEQATGAWLEQRVAQDYPYDAKKFGVDLYRQSYEEAYQAGITTALDGWTRRGSKNPYDAEANGVFPQDNSETQYGHEDFYNKGLVVGLAARARPR